MFVTYTTKNKQINKLTTYSAEKSSGCVRLNASERALR